MSEKMKEQYKLALDLETTKMDLRNKLRSNEKHVLLKYMKKLEMTLPLAETVTHEEILS